MSLLDVLDTWDRSRTPDLSDLGGERVVLEGASDLLGSPHLSILITAVVASWKDLDDRDAADQFVVSALRETPRLIELRDSLDAILGQADVLVSLGDQISRVLLQRSRTRDTEANAAIAAECLAGVIRLEFGGWTTNRLEIGAALASVADDEFDLFAIPVARLLSIAYEQWYFPELREALVRIESIPSVTADALHERAITLVADAVAEEAREDLLAGLESASLLFERAGRDDSRVYQTAIEGILSFARDLPAKETSEVADRLTDLVRQRSLGFHGMHRTWTAPRFEAEHEWLRLSWLLAEAGAAAEEADRNPEAAAAALFDAYAAARTVRLLVRTESGDAVARIIEPRVESQLLRDARARAAVLALLDAGVEPEDEEAAIRLRAAIASGKKKLGNWQRHDIPS